MKTLTLILEEHGDGRTLSCRAVIDLQSPVQVEQLIASAFEDLKAELEIAAPCADDLSVDAATHRT